MLNASLTRHRRRQGSEGPARSWLLPRRCSATACPLVPVVEAVKATTGGVRLGGGGRSTVERSGDEDTRG